MDHAWHRLAVAIYLLNRNIPVGESGAHLGARIVCPGAGQVLPNLVETTRRIRPDRIIQPRNPQRLYGAWCSRPARRVSVPLMPSVDQRYCGLQVVTITMPAIEVAGANPQHGLYLDHGVCKGFKRCRQQDHVSDTRKKHRSRTTILAI